MSIAGTITSAAETFLEHIDRTMDFLFFHKEKHHHHDHGGIEINGVMLPIDVATQLRELGVPLTSYSAGELRAAICACADGRLIDDKNGTNFLDKLVLTESEKREQEAGKDDAHCCTHFRDKILKEREEKCHTTDENPAQGLLGCCA